MPIRVVGVIRSPPYLHIVSVSAQRLCKSGVRVGCFEEKEIFDGSPKVDQECTVLLGRLGSRTTVRAATAKRSSWRNDQQLVAGRGWSGVGSKMRPGANGDSQCRISDLFAGGLVSEDRPA